MIKGSDITVNVIASIIASLILLSVGFVWGKYKERRRFGRKLEEYDFYPYAINRDNLPEFNLKDFRLGVHYFLKNYDYTAARQLIFIGEQNNVRRSWSRRSRKSTPDCLINTRGEKSPMTRTNISKTTFGSCAWFLGNRFRTRA